MPLEKMKEDTKREERRREKNSTIDHEENREEYARN
jgi:hypothetical protein